MRCVCVWLGRRGWRGDEWIRGVIRGSVGRYVFVLVAAVWVV